MTFPSVERRDSLIAAVFGAGFVEDEVFHVVDAAWEAAEAETLRRVRGLVERLERWDVDPHDPAGDGEWLRRDDVLDALREPSRGEA